jgi:N6-L-threonylcarbamoyladenine synthase
MKKSEVKILAIETSCDETAAAILHGKLGNKNPEFKILSSVVNSQIEIHKKSGGVIPEVAARAHVKNIVPVVKETLSKAKIDLNDIDYFAVTSGPGLIVSLVIGVEFTKALAMTTGKKIIPTNHMAGHLYSAFAEKPAKTSFPVVSLIVSGGHTMLMVLKDYKHYKVIGSTVDDAAGEAFDKVAKLLNLPYPGGPEISKLAEKGKPDFVFPRPMLNQKNFDFSFSGLKTSVRYHLLEQPAKTNQLKANVARAFEDAVVDTLVTKTIRAAQKYNAKTIALSGGVAANKKLRETLAKESQKNKINFTKPSFELCTDNAQMIAIAAYMRLLQGFKPVSYNKVNANPNWEL